MPCSSLPTATATSPVIDWGLTPLAHLAIVPRAVGFYRASPRYGAVATATTKLLSS